MAGDVDVAFDVHGRSVRALAAVPNLTSVVLLVVGGQVIV